MEINIDGRKQVVGPGSIVFFDVDENENMTNVGRRRPPPRPAVVHPAHPEKLSLCGALSWSASRRDLGGPALFSPPRLDSCSGLNHNK